MFNYSQIIVHWNTRTGPTRLSEVRYQEEEGGGGGGGGGGLSSVLVGIKAKS